MAVPVPIPPKVFYPRAVARLQVLFDDQVGGVTPAAFDAIPRTVDVRRNTARKADTCRVELDYRDFPLDPRLLKDVLIAVHIESVLDPLVDIIPTRLNLRFIGRVDEPHVTLGPDQETVRLEARDFTEAFTGFRWGATPIPTPPGTTLQAVVELIRAAVVPETVPTVFNDLAAAAAQVGERTGRSVFTPEDDDSAWDVMIKVCDLFGLVPVWDLDVLTVRTAAQAGIGSAFMIYGQNVESLKFSRNLKQKKAKQVKIVAWNPVLGASLEAVYPVNPADVGTTRISAQGTPKVTVEQVQYNVEGPYDPVTLGVLAQRVYAELAQSQLIGTLETRDMRDVFEAPIVGLKNGDLLICKLGPEVQASIESMSPPEAIAFLSNPVRPNALNPGAAAALVAAWMTVQQLAVQFYVTEAHHRWDRDNGYSLEIGFREFVLGV